MLLNELHFETTSATKVKQKTNAFLVYLTTLNQPQIFSYCEMGWKLGYE